LAPKFERTPGSAAKRGPKVPLGQPAQAACALPFLDRGQESRGKDRIMSRFMFVASPVSRLGLVAALTLGGPALAAAQPNPFLPPASASAAPAATLPPVIEVPACPPATCAYRPLVAVTAMPPAYEVGRGILGQPKLYVPRQPVRNFVRWLTP